MCAKKEWRLPMNLRVETDGPLTFVLSPEAVERKSKRALPRKSVSSSPFGERLGEGDFRRD
jgi:hypothetical protein